MNENNVEKINDDYKFAMNTIEMWMLKINELKSLSLADECKWDDMNTMLLSSTFQNELDKSCAIIKNKLLSLKNTEACAEIGFNWGSCVVDIVVH